MAIHTVLQLLLLLACSGSSGTATTPVAWRASGLEAPRNKRGIRLRQSPSANCPNKCGDQPIEFPFGIGPGCFRHPGFAVICNKTTSPPRLFLKDGLKEVVDPGIQASRESIRVNISHTISTTTSPAVNVYNGTWKVPARNFFLADSSNLNFTARDFYSYLVGNPNINPEIPICTSCDRPGSYTVYRKACYHPDICIFGSTLRLKFAHRKKAHVQQRQKAEVLALAGSVYWSIDDQPSWAAASVDKATFACASNHGSWVYNPMSLGYSCGRIDGYRGNPYVLKGCSSYDYGYDPSAQRNVTCSRYYGETLVPFPFGLEEGSSARMAFKLTDGDNVGYRCKCNDGYDGHPYITSPCGGCHDNNEREELGRCEGLCHNTNGSYTCAKCGGTVKMKCFQPRRQTIFLGVGIGLSVRFGLLLLGLGAMLLIHRWRRNIQKQLRRNYFTKNRGLLLGRLISSNEDASERTKIYSLEDLTLATSNFDRTRILGRGGHGIVYKGILSDQRVVAIKRSKVITQGEIDQFINEVAILSQVNHRNIVKLYGCCLETEVPLLVYDFVPNGSLFEVLHSGSSNNFSLSWGDCLRIAAEAAGALFYLHSAASVSVFHRDVKSANILLDANYTAKVSDFGASRLVDIDQTHISTNVQGTFGYLDPEYCHTGQLNEKSDVYSFGVVLLELLLRRKPVFATETGSAQNLCNYFLEEMQKRPVKEIVASQVHEEATEEEITNVASLAEMCLQLRGEGRPTMKTVEMSLQYLHMNRLKAFRITPENHRGMQSGNTTDPISANSQRCYSLEQEFMSSASIPR